VKKFLIEVDEDGNEYAVENPEYARKRRKELYSLLLKKSNIPDFYHDIEFKDYRGNKDSEEFKKIVYYAENCYKDEFKHSHLYLYGNHSTQKTALACNILKEAMRNGMRGKFILAGTLIDKLMKLQGFNHDEELYEEIKELSTVDILVCDDAFDVQKSIMWKTESRNMIICEWDRFLRDLVSRGTRVILTSNFAKEPIKEHYGDSLHELIDRNFIFLHLVDSVKSHRKMDLEKIFKDMK